MIYNIQLVSVREWLSGEIVVLLGDSLSWVRVPSDAPVASKKSSCYLIFMLGEHSYNYGCSLTRPKHCVWDAADVGSTPTTHT